MWQEHGEALDRYSDDIIKSVIANGVGRSDQPGPTTAVAARSVEPLPRASEPRAAPPSRAAVSRPADQAAGAPEEESKTSSESVPGLLAQLSKQRTAPGLSAGSPRV